MSSNTTRHSPPQTPSTCRSDRPHDTGTAAAHRDNTANTDSTGPSIKTRSRNQTSAWPHRRQHSGSQMRYNVSSGEQLVALLSFGASAWKLAGRERFIGWQEPERLKKLQLVVNNARLLILPWVQSKGLASKILSKIARQLPVDWRQRYGYRPVLFETFVDSQRHLVAGQQRLAGELFVKPGKQPRHRRAGVLRSARATAGSRRKAPTRPEPVGVAHGGSAGRQNIHHAAPGNARGHRRVDVLQPAPASRHIGLRQSDEVCAKLAHDPAGQRRAIEWLWRVSNRGKVTSAPRP